MAKKSLRSVKLQLPAGKATPGPPVGSTLGPHGINIPGSPRNSMPRLPTRRG